MKWNLIYLFSFWAISIFSQTVRLDSSNLPICLIDTRGKTIVNEPKILAHMKIIDNGPGRMNKITDKVYQYNNFIAIEIRGNSSQFYPQKQYGIELRDSLSGDDLDAPLMGMPAEEDWVLYAPYNDISMLRNVMTYHLWNAMGHWGPRTRFCELILNNEYVGIYLLTESIKRGPDRVDISKLTMEDTSGLALTGGYIMKIDKVNNSTDLSFVSKIKSTNNQNISWVYHYPDSNDIRLQQKNYIQRYIDTVEQVISSPYFNDPVNGFRKYLSVPSFIDYYLITEFSRNIDAYKASSFFYKEKKEQDGGKGQFKAGPVWDYNFAFGNASFCSGAQSTGWMVEGCIPATLPTPVLWRRLLQDTHHLNAIKCRYLELRSSILDTGYLFRFMNSYAFDTLDAAQKRHFSKWKILGTNPGGFNAYIATSYIDEMNRLKTWIRNRLNWMDANLSGRCLPQPVHAKIEIPLDPECFVAARPMMQVEQPFQKSPFNYNGMEKVKTIPANILRWVLVELRDAKDSTKLIDRRAALLRSDSVVVDTNFNAGIYFPKAIEREKYFILVRYDAIGFLMSNEAVELPNENDYNLNRNHRLTKIDPKSPLVYELRLFETPKSVLCDGDFWILNDSIIMSYGYAISGDAIKLQDFFITHYDQHHWAVGLHGPGIYDFLQFYVSCGGFTVMRTIHYGVDVFERPNLVIVGNDSICVGDSIALDAGIHKSFIWNTGATNQILVVTAPGKYSVSVTNEEGCLAMTEKEIYGYPEINGELIAQADLQTNTCKYYFLPTLPNSGYRYEWSTGSTADTLLSRETKVHVWVRDSNDCVKQYTSMCNLVGTEHNHVVIQGLSPNPNNGRFWCLVDEIPDQIILQNAEGFKIPIKWSMDGAGIVVITIEQVMSGWYTGRLIRNGSVRTFRVLVVE